MTDKPGQRQVQTPPGGEPAAARPVRSIAPPSYGPRRVTSLPEKPLGRRVYDVAVIGPDVAINCSRCSASFSWSNCFLSTTANFPIVHVNPVANVIY